MIHRDESASHVLLPSDFQVGDRVVFVRESDPKHPYEDPLYEPPIPQGSTGVIVKVANDHLRVRLEDSSIAPEPVRLWQDGLFADGMTNTLGAIRKL